MRTYRWHRYLAFALMSWILLPTLTAQQPSQQEQPKEPEVKLPAILKSKPAKIDPKDDELTKLLKARYNEAVGEMNAQVERYVSGTAVLDLTLEAGRRLLVSGLEMMDKPADRIAMLEQYLELAKEVEKVTKAQHDAARIPIQQMHQVRYYRLDAEIQLLRAKRKLEQDKRPGK